MDLLKEGVMSGLRIREALALCLEYNLKITAQALINNGLRYDFAGKYPGDHRIFFSKQGLISWLLKKNETPPPGPWMTVVEAAALFHHPKESIYGWITKKTIKAVRVGLPPGRVYVHFDEVKERIANRDPRGSSRRKKEAPSP